MSLILFKKRKCECTTFQKAFGRLIKENKLLIHYKDVFTKKLIALDKMNEKLLLLDTNKKFKAECCVKLDKINSCDLIQLKDKFSNHLKQVSLVIVYETNKEARFCFYDDACDCEQEKSCLILKAQHWMQRINFHKTYWWLNSNEYII